MEEPSESSSSEPELSDLSNTSIFPNEILMKILSKVDTIVLETVCARVCCRWKEVADAVIEKRVLKIASIVPEIALKEMKLRMPHESSDLVLLKEYERSYVSSQFNISTTAMDKDIFIRRIWKKRACDCEDIDVCITRVIHFMNCFNLILVQLPEKMHYYHETDPFRKLSSGDCEIEPYLTAAPVIRVDNNTHAAVSVFRDRVVVHETPRVLMLFQVVKVDHEERSVTVERIRRIFLPLWSCAVTLCYNKVFVLFTTGFLGVWHGDSDALVISDNKCGSAETVKTMRLTTMYRCNELIFIKLWSPNDVSWTIVDSNETALNLHNVPMNSLITAAFSGVGDCCQVNQLNVWNNALIVHCKIAEGNYTDHKILIGRMKEDPKREHFLSQQCFQDLFYPLNEKYIQHISLSGSVTSPFSPIISERHSSNAVSFLAIQKYLTESFQRRRLRLLCIQLRNPD